jgi:hypothetical protein
VQLIQTPSVSDVSSFCFISQTCFGHHLLCRADTTPQKMEATNSTNTEETRRLTQKHDVTQPE